MSRKAKPGYTPVDDGSVDVDASDLETSESSDLLFDDISVVRAASSSSGRQPKAFTLPFDRMDVGQTFLVPKQREKLLKAERIRANSRFAEATGETKTRADGKIVKVKHKSRKFVVFLLTQEQIDALSSADLKAVFAGTGQTSKPVAGDVFAVKRTV